jgi:hypothetical protein
VEEEVTMDTTKRPDLPGTMVLKGVDLTLKAADQEFPGIAISVEWPSGYISFPIPYEDAALVGSQILEWDNEDECRNRKGCFETNWDSVSGGEGRLTIIEMELSDFWFSVQMVEDFKGVYADDPAAYDAWSDAFREYMRPFGEWLKTIGEWSVAAIAERDKEYRGG